MIRFAGECELCQDLRLAQEYDRPKGVPVRASRCPACGRYSAVDSDFDLGVQARAHRGCRDGFCDVVEQFGRGHGARRERACAIWYSPPFPMLALKTLQMARSAVSPARGTGERLTRARGLPAFQPPLHPHTPRLHRPAPIRTRAAWPRRPERSRGRQAKHTQSPGGSLPRLKFAEPLGVARRIFSPDWVLPPPSRHPRTLARTSRAAPAVIAESARLNVGGKYGSLIQSITKPRSGPGDRKSRSTRLPAAPPRSSPRAIAHGQLRNFPDTRRIAASTPAAISAYIAVYEGPTPNAAPGLRYRCRVINPPSRATDRWGDKAPTARTLEATSRAHTANPIKKAAIAYRLDLITRAPRQHTIAAASRAAPASARGLPAWDEPDHRVHADDLPQHRSYSQERSPRTGQIPIAAHRPRRGHLGSGAATGNQRRRVRTARTRTAPRSRTATPRRSHLVTGPKTSSPPCSATWSVRRGGSSTATTPQACRSGWRRRTR